MTTYYVDSAVANGFDQANRTWALNDLMYVRQDDTSTNADRSRPHAWKCTTGGTTNGVPAWQAGAITDGSTTVTQNSTVFTAQACTTRATANKHLGNMVRLTGAVVAAGDTIYVSSASSESLTGNTNVSITLTAGRLANPIKIICADFSTGEPPTAVATTAISLAASGAGGFGISPWLGNQGGFYIYGMIFKAGGAGGNSSFDDIELQGGASAFGYVCEKCQFHILNDSAGDTSHFMPQGGAIIAAIAVFLNNCDVFLKLSTQYIAMGRAYWKGGSLLASTAAVKLFQLQGNTNCIVEAVDLSAGPTAMDLFFTNGAQLTADFAKIANCKLPASWSGLLLNTSGGALGPMGRIEMINCWSGAINYRYWCDTDCGTIRDQETTLILTGGASDGTTAYSHKIVTTAAGKFPHNHMRLPDLRVWNDTTGSSKTATVEFLHDSANALNNDDIWMDLYYAGDSGDPLWLIGTNRKADVLASNAAVTSSSANWDTTGMSNPNKQKLQVTFTPQLKGIVVARVCIVKNSYMLYVDPKIVIT